MFEIVKDIENVNMRDKRKTDRQTNRLKERERERERGGVCD